MGHDYVFSMAVGTIGNGPFFVSGRTVEGGGAGSFLK